MEFEFLDEFTVLIVEESTTLQELFTEWIAGVPTKTVSSPASIPGAFDATITVACLSQTALEEKTESIQQSILTRNPYCQVIGVLPRASFVSPYEDQFDAILQRPLFKEEFQETIEYRFIVGVYSSLLSELYDINSSLLAIRRAGADEIGVDQEAIDRVHSRRNELNTQLQSLQENLSGDSLLSIIQTIDRHSKHLRKPDTETEEGRATKFRPRRCPACKLPWGVNHRNDLGSGYRTLGANVYQCARCENIVHGLAGEQRVL